MRSIIRTLGWLVFAGGLRREPIGPMVRLAFAVI
jgi:hypothetical protein